LIATAAAALTLPLIAFASVHPAQAEGVWIGSCVGSGYAASCMMLWAPRSDPYIRKVPQPGNTAERARAREEDRRWVEGCHPTIHPDRYGVPRYHYTRPGCEFGDISY
jgi:hypothetical protein